MNPAAAPPASPSASDALGRLFGQWIEAVDLDPAGRVGGIVTSRGWILRGAFEVPELSRPERDDGRLIGQIIVSAEIAPGGRLALALARIGEDGGVLLSSPAPWLAAGPKGLALTARLDGALGVRPETGRQIATDAAMAAWSASEPDELELEVLRRAEDDWISPADIASELIDLGCKAPAAIAQRGTAALARLLARGELRLGTLGEDGFQAAAGERAELIEQAVSSWRALSARIPAAGQIAWLELTEAGARRTAQGR